MEKVKRQLVAVPALVLALWLATEWNRERVPLCLGLLWFVVLVGLGTALLYWRIYYHLR